VDGGLFSRRQRTSNGPRRSSLACRVAAVIAVTALTGSRYT
jgi:hypothetical protein